MCNYFTYYVQNQSTGGCGVVCEYMAFGADGEYITIVDSSRLFFARPYTLAFV